MAEGAINNLSLFGIVLAILLVDVFCRYGASAQTWHNQNSVVTSPFLGGSTSTTPWPVVGSKRVVNSQSNHQNTTSRVQLSYNTNPNFQANQTPNLPQRINSPNNAGGPHSGLALSYGLGQATHVPNPKTTPIPINRNLNQNSNQNIPKLAQQNQGVWGNSGKTQEVIGNLAPSTPKPNLPPPSQLPVIQNLPSTVGSSKTSTPSSEKPPENEDEELRQFFEQLIRKDNGNVAQEISVNYQGKTTSRSSVDEAPLPLLQIPKTVYDTSSVSKLLALHNNYILETNVNEHVTPQERLEENDLLDTIVGTPVMQAARNFLVQKGAISKDPKDFRDKLKEIWFTMYSRGGGRVGSSGFEHVFLAEIKHHDVSGLHNWLYFKDAEEKGLANYLGYMRKIDLGNKGAILKYHFTFNGLDKPVGSMFIGTSPELEIALYSTCFLLKPDKVCPMRFDGKKFIIRTYTFRYRGKNMIGSAFPEI